MMITAHQIPVDPEVILFDQSIKLPTTRLLKNHDNGAKKPSRGELRDTSEKITEHLLSFQITGTIEGASVGPCLPPMSTNQAQA